MKYFKMRESKRKISFIMALALIVSLLPVSPVVKAAETTETMVYIDNELSEQTNVNIAKDVAGEVTVNVSGKTGITLTEKDKITIKAVAATEDDKDIVPTASAIATDGAVSGTKLDTGILTFSNGIWSAKVTGIMTDIKVMVSGTIAGSTTDPTPTPTAVVTKPPVTTATVSAISESNKNAFLSEDSKVLTSEQKEDVKTGTATLELNPIATVAPLPTDGKEKDALDNCINNADSATKKAINNLIGTPGKAFVFDLTIDLMFVKDGNKTKVSEVGGFAEAITVEMPLPDAYKNVGNVTYFVIRIHKDADGNVKAEILPCTVTGDKFKFESKKFSKFILCYKENKPWLSVTTPGPTTKPNATATPSASPSASAVPSATPVATTVPSGTNTPTDGATDGNGNNNPDVNKPDTGDGSEDGNTSTSGSSSKIKKGQKYTVNGIKYEIISTDSTKTVGFANGKKNSKKITIPATVKIKGKTFKVKSIKSNAFNNSKKLTTLVIGANVKIIEKNAFKGCKNLKKITIKSKKLTAAKVAKNAFKGINKKATVKVPKNKVKAYTKIVKVKGGAGNSVKVTK